MRKAFEMIDTIVRNDIEAGFPCAQIAIMQDGKFLFEKAWGNGITTDTLFDLASNTKMYSAVYAIQYLVSRGQLDLSATVCDLMGAAFAENVLPLQFDEHTPGIDLQRRWKKELQLRDILSHHAGLIPEAQFLYRKDFSFFGQSGNPLYIGLEGTMDVRRKVWDALCRMPLAAPPRQEIRYSDMDYILLGLVVEKVTGMGLDAFLRQTFFSPLGLQSITYNPLKNGFRASDCAPTELHGNTRDGAVDFEGIRRELIRGEVHDECTCHALAGISGHAGLFATAHDLARLAHCMVEPGAFFSPAVIEQFTSPFSNDHDEWGLGWYRQGKGKRIGYFGAGCAENTVGHQGWTGTLTVIDRQERLVLVILTSKRHTPVTDPTKDPNMFDGNFYTTGKLGFVSALVHDALQGKDFRETVDRLEQDLVLQEQQNSCPAAHKALCSFRKSRKEQEGAIFHDL